MPRLSGWTGTSLLTAAGVTLLAALAWTFPELYKAWALCGLFAIVFGFMLLRNPAYRYMRLAGWLAGAWAATTAMPQFKAWLRAGGGLDGGVEVGNEVSGWFHVAFLTTCVVCLLLDAFSDPENSYIRDLVKGLSLRIGGQRQHVTGGTAIQVETRDHSPVAVTVQQADPNRELDFARDMLNRGNVEAVEQHLLRLNRDHGTQLTTQQKFRLHAYLGRAYDDLDDRNKAAIHYSKAQAERAGDAEGQAHGALAELAAGRPTEAHRVALAVLQSDPRSVIAAAVRIRTAGETVTAAQLEATTDATIRGEPDVLNALGFRALTRQDAASAEGYFRRALAREPDHPFFKYSVAAAVVVGEARRAAGARWTADAPARTRLGEAERLLSDGMASMRPKQVVQEARSLRGMARELLGQAVESEADHVAAMEVDRTAPHVVMRYAGFLMRRARPGDALPILRPLIRADADLTTAIVFAVATIEAKAVADRPAAWQGLEFCRPQMVGADPDTQDDALSCLAVLADVVGTAGAVRAIDSLPPGVGSPAMRHALCAEILLEAGDPVAADRRATEALTHLTEATMPRHREQVAQVLGRLRRFAELVAAARPIATPERLESVGRRALAAARECGDHAFILDYSQRLRQSGVWDARVFELEVETLREYHEPDRAAEVTRGFIERSADAADRRFARLRLSAIGLEFDRRDLIETNEADLPDPLTLAPEHGRILSAVLLHGPTPIRAVEVAYDLVRRHYSSQHAHFALCAAVGLGRESPASIPEPEVVGPGAAVCTRLDGEAAHRWVVVEDCPNPDPGRNELPPDHPSLKDLLGKRVGDRFTDARNPFQPKPGTILEVRSKYHYRMWDSIERWDDLCPGVSFIQRFNLQKGDSDELDFGPILRAMEEHDRSEDGLKRFYRENPISTQTFGLVGHRSTLDALRYLVAHGDLPIRCCNGTLDEFAAGRRAANAGKLVLDGTALGTLFLSGLFRRITALPVKLIACRSALIEYQHLAEDERQGSDLRVDHEGDQLVRIVLPPGERERFADLIDEFVAWVEAHCDLRGGAALASLPGVTRGRLVKMFGRPGAEAIALARSEAAPLWTDDLIAAIASAHECPVERTWTQLVGERLRGAGAVTEDDLVDLLQFLIVSGYEHTQCMPGVVVRAARLAEWDPARWPFERVLAWLGSERIDSDGVTAVAVHALQLIGRDAVLVHQRESAIEGVGRALARRPGGRDVVAALARLADRLFPFERHKAASCRQIMQRLLAKPPGAPLIYVPEEYR